MKLPAPHPDALIKSTALKQIIAQEINTAKGWISFYRFMELALYTPNLGYYAGYTHKFGAAGDFVTAPEISPIFAQTLAAQVAQILRLSAPNILEVGAGSGRLAVDLLRELDTHHACPATYQILELSGELRDRQQQTIAESLPHLLDRVTWLSALPEHFDGAILGNELLDALPVHLLLWGIDGAESAIFERGVAWNGEDFEWLDRPASGRLLQKAQALAAEYALPMGFLSEINLAAQDWVANWGRILGQGALLLIDYGFPRHEYYHEQRNSGTLMCHYRHHAHPEPFFLPGLQDITAHIDFTSIVDAADQAGLDFLGYTTQASFLINCGLSEILSRTSSADALRYLPQAQAAQKLISPAEMGDLFKVLALGKRIDEILMGFVQGDRSETL